MLLEEPLPLETARESPSFKLEPMETERNPGPRLQELLGPSPQRDPQAVKERGEEQRAGGRERVLGLSLTPEDTHCRAQGIFFASVFSFSPPVTFIYWRETHRETNLESYCATCCSIQLRTSCFHEATSWEREFLSRGPHKWRERPWRARLGFFWGRRSQGLSQSILP